MFHEPTPYRTGESEPMRVEEQASHLMRSSTLYSYPLLVLEVEGLRKSVAELRNIVKELQASQPAAPEAPEEK